MAKRLAGIAFIIFIGTIGISIFKNQILHIWLGNQFINISYTSFLLFSVYTLFHCLNAILINIQNGLGQLKIQILSTTISIIIYFTGCYIFDIRTTGVGFNFLIVLKIIGTVVAITINSLTLKQLVR